MKYKVIYEAAAAKALRKMDKSQSKIIMSWVNKNLFGTDNPRLQGKALTGDMKGYWRYRVGTYRLVATIDDNKLTIVMVDVGHRRDIYR